MDALSDHEVVKFIGRDCRALEAGYEVLLTFLCEDSAAYAKRLEAKNAALLTRQAAADAALESLEAQEEEFAASDDGLAEEEERLMAYRLEVENERDEVAAALRDAVTGSTPPPMQEQVSVHVPFTIVFMEHSLPL